MNKQEIYQSLINIYTDHFDGLYTKDQLKFMLRKIHSSNPQISIQEFSSMCLDAQWENASEDDYINTRKINEQIAKDENVEDK